ncbi:MAG: dephospho-CoA kinase [Anaerolineae bacterium]
MYRIGLTGNIATGKTLVLRRLAQLGAYCLDADDLAHRAMQRDTPVYQAVHHRFGDAVIAADGEVDRRALGGVVFRDAAALADLEGIIHPWVVAEVERLLADSGASVGVVEAIKLLEASLGSRCDAIWVTTADPAEQQRRLMRDRGLDATAAALRIAAQPPAEDKVRRADVLLENDAAPSDLLALVDAEWQDVAAGRAPRRGTAIAEPAVDGSTVSVIEAGQWAEAQPLSPGEWRLRVSRPTRMPRLCRSLLPELERLAHSRGHACPTLLLAARTGYRQFMTAMGYEELGISGRDSGESAYRRAV